MTKPIPDGYSTVTATITVREAEKAKKFLMQKNFTDFQDLMAKQ